MSPSSHPAWRALELENSTIWVQILAQPFTAVWPQTSCLPSLCPCCLREWGWREHQPRAGRGFGENAGGETHVR